MIIKKTSQLISLGTCLFIQSANADIWTDFSKYQASEHRSLKSLPLHDLVLKTPTSEMAEIEQKLLKILNSSASTPSAKNYSLRMLNRMASDASVPSMKKLLSDDKMSSYARSILEVRLKDSKMARDLLLSELKNSPDHIKVGIISSLGRRGDKKAIPVISSYVNSDDVALVKAALMALSQIGGKEALEITTNAQLDSAQRQAAYLKASSQIKDQGSFFSLDNIRAPIGSDYVKNHGQSGWKGEYFSNPHFEGETSMERIDEAIHFDWKQGSPSSDMPKNNFSVRWTGTLTPPKSRKYTFFLNTDDGVHFSVDGKVLVNKLNGGYRDQVSASLEGNKPIQVEVKFREGGGDARAILEWDCPSMKDIIASRDKIINLPIVAQQRSMLENPEAMNAAQLERLIQSAGPSALQVGAFIQLLKLDTKAAQKVLSGRLKNTNDRSSASMIRAAMESGSKAMQTMLVNSLPQTGEHNQRAILGSLSDLKLSEYEKNVLALLPQASDKIREDIYITLGLIGGLDSFQPLYEACQKFPSRSVSLAITTLRVPSVDERLLKVAEDRNETLADRQSAIESLVLRQPTKAPALFSKLVQPDQDKDIRKAAFKAMENAGNKDNTLTLAKLIVSKDEMMRDAQRALKRLCIRLNDAYSIWGHSFKPMLNSSQDLKAKEALIAIIDGIPTGATVNFLKKVIMDHEHPLRPAALKSLKRWPNLEASKAWIALISKEDVNTEDLKAAESGIKRLLTSKMITESIDKKMEFAVKAIKCGPNADFKKNIVACYSDLERRDRGRMKGKFSSLMNDPDVGSDIKAILKSL
jgi:HEAT repeat protein